MKITIPKKFAVFAFILFIMSCRAENPVEQSSFVGNDIFSNVELTTIYSPEYQRNYPPGGDLKIQWEPTPGVDKITINLYRKSSHIDVIAQGYKNSGEYIWHIPEGLPRSHHYKVEIQDSELMNYSSKSPVFFILDK